MKDKAKQIIKKQGKVIRSLNKKIEELEEELETYKTDILDLEEILDNLSYELGLVEDQPPLNVLHHVSDCVFRSLIDANKK